LISADPIDAGALIAHLDDAGIARAAVLSVAYTFGSPNRTVEHEYDQVRATNDWTNRQVARFPDRLRGFCGLNPLRDYALEELARCAQDRSLRHVRSGLKLHFGNSVVDYHDPRHVAQLQRVLRSLVAEVTAVEAPFGWGLTGRVLADGAPYPSRPVPGSPPPEDL
jgi:predicted TIM-barrel fold metal-dependent hydrolase